MEELSIKNKILSYSLFYKIFQNLVSEKGSRKKFVDNFLKPFSGMKMVDFGCGPGSIIKYLPNHMEYVGVDIEKNYIDSAKKKYSKRGTFICEDIASFSSKKRNYFDIALASGVLHHLDDDKSIKLLKSAKSILKPGGRLVTLDNVYINNQNLFARYLIDMDRGCNVRTLDQYMRIGHTVFSKIDYCVIHDLLWVPYTHLVMTLTK